MVVPLRVGGGTRIKVLEAFSFKRPVVSTTLGVEGLEVDNEKHILIADHPQHFRPTVLPADGGQATLHNLNHERICMPCRALYPGGNATNPQQNYDSGTSQSTLRS